MTRNEIRASVLFHHRCCILCLIAFFATALIPHTLGSILNVAAVVGMIGFAIAGARVGRQLSQVALHDRGLPDHCLKCGNGLDGRCSGRCPVCMKGITPGDVQGDPSWRPSAETANPMTQDYF